MTEASKKKRTRPSFTLWLLRQSQAKHPGPEGWAAHNAWGIVRGDLALLLGSWGRRDLSADCGMVSSGRVAGPLLPQLPYAHDCAQVRALGPGRQAAAESTWQGRFSWGLSPVCGKEMWPPVHDRHAVPPVGISSVEDHVAQTSAALVAQMEGVYVLCSRGYRRVWDAGWPALRGLGLGP